MQTRWSTRRIAALLALAAMLSCALCTSTYRVFGNFRDEPEHIAAGLALIDRGQYLYDDQHPPLARLAAAIGPYLAGARLRATPDPSGVAEGQQVLYHSARHLWLAAAIPAGAARRAVLRAVLRALIRSGLKSPWRAPGPG